MAQKGKMDNPKDVDITFGGYIKFKGPLSQFRTVMQELGKLSVDGLMVGTWPQPEHPGSTMMIDTVPLPENPRRGMMVDTIPLPEQPPPGLVPFAKLVSRTVLNKAIDGRPSLKLNKDINGGIRNPHLHIGGEIVFLDAGGFRDLVVNVSRDITVKMADELGFTPTVKVLERLTRLVM